MGLIMNKSLNLGDKDKIDWTFVFDDFPTFWADRHPFDKVIHSSWDILNNWCLHQISVHDLQKARKYGCVKYDRDNWALSKGTEDHENFMLKNRKSIYRHLVAYSEGETTDPESGCHHLAHVALRCLIAIEYDQHGSPAEVENPISHKAEFLDGSTPSEPTP